MRCAPYHLVLVPLIVAVTGMIPSAARAQCPPAWLQPAGLQAGPGIRTATAMAFDRPRGAVVMFGGYGATLSRLDDTWTAAGDLWLLASPTTSPSARGGHTMAADTTRGRVLLFGGNSQSHQALNDLWAWDGNNWLLLDDGADIAPAPRKDAALVYDPVRDRAVLFGGNAGGLSTDEVWEWDGSSWTNVSPAAGGTPGTRSLMAAGYDEQRRRTVIFGGFAGATALQDVWTWDGAAWEQIDTPGVTPAARYAAAMWYDPDRRCLVLFGGSAAGLALNDVWDLCGSTWTDRGAAGGPSPRSSVRGAYDVIRSRAIVFGGFAGPITGETWTVAFPGRITVLTPPMPKAVAIGATIDVSVSIAGLAPSSFLWRRGGVQLADGDLGGRVSGAITGTLTINPARVGDDGDFDVIITNACGQTTSPAAHVRIDPPCTADVDDGSGSGTPDGGVAIEDLTYFLQLFNEGSLAADIDDSSGTGARDGGLDINDLLYYLYRFDSGC